jgi:hypothetical protein
VGTHIDHRLTYRAAVAVLGSGGLTFYEDRPYVLVPGHLAMRLAELSLQADVPAVSPAEFLEAFREAQYVRTYLSGSEREECEALLQGKLAAVPGATKSLRSETVVSSDVEPILDAIALYETQLADLYGGVEGLRGESLRYAVALGHAGYAERYWHEDVGQDEVRAKAGGRAASAPCCLRKTGG